MEIVKLNTRKEEIRIASDWNDLTFNQIAKLMNAIIHHTLKSDHDLYELIVIDGVNYKDLTIGELKAIAPILDKFKFDYPLVKELIINGKEYHILDKVDDYTAGEFEAMNSIINQENINGNLLSKFLAYILKEVKEKRVKKNRFVWRKLWWLIKKNFRKNIVKPQREFNIYYTNFSETNIKEKQKLIETYIDKNNIYQIIMFFFLHELRYLTDLLSSPQMQKTAKQIRKKLKRIKK